MKIQLRTILLVTGSVAALAGATAAQADAAPAAAAPAAAPSTVAADTTGNPIGNSDDIVVTATKVNKETPITASVNATEPQAIVSRSIIENSVPATSDISDVALLTPGASGTNNGNGPGLSESKTVLRGFQDGQYNITYDGIPFADSNDPTHHSTAYFPNGTYERIIVDRGPGGATDLGQASYGGNIHIISRELSDRGFVEGQGAYGSYNTWLGRLTLNSGTLQSLGGLKVIGVGEYKRTDGALTGSGAWFYNLFAKAELPIGNNAKFSILSSFNKNFYHQSDNNGVTCSGKLTTTAGGAGPFPVTDGSNCTATSQVGLYGKGFGLVDINDPQFAGTPWPHARSDWNWTQKTTDFEIARLQWNVNDVISIDDKAYTYYYKNFTYSSQNSTGTCTAGTITATTCGGISTPNKFGVQTGTATAGTGTTTATGAGGALVNNPNDIGGYTKQNQYRTSGNIIQINVRTSFGTGKIGFWYEHSHSHRYRYAYDSTLAFAAGAFTDGTFDFAQMAKFYDYSRQANKASNVTLANTPVPSYLAYDEYTSWDQYQGFGEFEFKLLDDKLSITPGVKVQNFTRKINTPLASQTARIGINAEASFKPTLPYATINYLIRPDLSVYGQFAKGFLIPSLSSSLESRTNPDGSTGTAAQPTRTTNYQAGVVYAGDRLNIDADAYYIKATSTTIVDPSTGLGVQSGEPVTYQGVEAQISYVFAKGLTGIVNGSLNSAKGDVSKMWIAQAPNYTALAGLIYNHGPFKFSYLHKFTGTQYADSASVTVTAGVATATGGQLVRIKPYSTGTLAASYTYKQITFGVTVYNVFDDQSTSKIGGSTGSNPLYFFQPGRSYQGQVKFKF